MKRRTRPPVLRSAPWIPCLLAALCMMWAEACSRPQKDEPLVLATTTSTRDSGLLEVLLPALQKATGIEVRVVAVGSGQALAMGERGDADFLITHAPEGEAAFAKAGHAALSKPLMSNRFVLVGPPGDPAGLAEAGDVREALRRLASSRAVFVSRGDESGTHRKERDLWAATGLVPDWTGYTEAGTGMAAVLRVAHEKRGYALSDISTFLFLSDHLELEILFSEDPLLENPYRVMVVSAEKHPGIQEERARQAVSWLLSPRGQEIISSYGRDRFGRPLFEGIGSGVRHQRLF